jgi:hypothetical protein
MTYKQVWEYQKQTFSDGHYQLIMIVVQVMLQLNALRLKCQSILSVQLLLKLDNMSKGYLDSGNQQAIGHNEDKESLAEGKKENGRKWKN